MPFRLMQVENGPTGNSSAKGKSACTKFTRVSTNGTESIVLCEPITGRTHQVKRLILPTEVSLILTSLIIEGSIFFNNYICMLKLFRIKVLINDRHGQ